MTLGESPQPLETPEGYRIELDDKGQPAAWIFRPGADEVSFAMQYVNGKWNPTQGALLICRDLDEINRAMDWLQENYPEGVTN